MAMPFLATKPYVPPLRRERVPRPHLIARLNAGLRRHHRLTLISAPAGFGKTTPISEWMDNPYCMPLHEAAVENGCMQFMSGTHPGGQRFIIAGPSTVQARIAPLTHGAGRRQRCGPGRNAEPVVGKLQRTIKAVVRHHQD